MSYFPQIGIDIPRKESWNKVTGTEKYNGDTIIPGIFHGKILASTSAHAIIKSIDTSEAWKVPGVKSIITGDYYPILSGSLIQDRPPIARGKVRYFGEPVAIVVANSEEEAIRATQLIKVDYDHLPVVNSISDSIKPDATLIHEDLALYNCTVSDVYPQHNTNIPGLVKIRKGNINKGWSKSDIIIESDFSLPQSDHLAMETRNARVEIFADGTVMVYTSSQAPFSVKENLSNLYNIPEGKIIVRVPLVGGAFGGKATTQIELLAYLASRAVGGKMVQITNSREEDITSSPSKIGAEARLKMGVSKEGIIQALECSYFVDCGAYSDTGPRMAKAIAVDCTGPYNIENVSCDAFSVYTNHPYVTSYRGFGHTAFTFCIERMMDNLALSLEMDPLELRMINSISDGNLSPTQDKTTISNTGNLNQCLLRLKDLINWQDGNKLVTDKGTVISKGISCFWKTSDSPTNASSGVILTLNSEGSVNLNFGGVEIGPGTKTTISQILAEKLQMDVDKIHVFMGVDTETSPKHWKTVASMTTFMAGNAVIQAAEELIRQLRSIGSIVLKCLPDDLDIKDQVVYLRSNPDHSVKFKDLVHGYEYGDGSSIGGQMIARGNYMMKHLTPLDPETGEGKAGPSWTVGAQAVEIEYNPKNYSYRLVKATTVIDVGKVINPKTAKGLIMGGMNMGLGLATREEFLFDDYGMLENSSLRTYKLMRYGENPKYAVEFIETPQIDAPFGARCMGEHGILGMPAAFANAISIASGADFNVLPISPEVIWKTKTGGKI